MPLNNRSRTRQLVYLMITLCAYVITVLSLSAAHL